MQFTCSTCGQTHDVAKITLGADRPVQWEYLTDAEREASVLGDETCIIDARDGRHFFLRACLEVPIRGEEECFVWGVWVSLSEASFREVFANWESAERTRLGPYFGWLCTSVPEYPETVFLKTLVHQREVGTRPRVELEPTDHPLALHQREGIEPEELERIVVKLLHESHVDGRVKGDT